AGFSNIILNDSLLTDSVKAIVNLTPLLNYFWKVRAKNDAGWGAFSTTFTFNTIGVPGQVVLSYPVNNAVNLPVNLTFLWRKATDQTNFAQNIFNNPKTLHTLNTVSNYWFELAADSSFTNLIIRDSTLTDTTKSVTSLGNLTSYFWRVKAKNELGWGNFSAWFKFTTIPAVPAAPILSSPLNGSTGNQLSLILQWRKSAYATAYKLQLATDSLFNNLVLNDSTLTDSLRTVTGLNLLSTYYWRVNAGNIAGTGVYSSVWNFRTLGTPTAVTLLSPANNAINQPVNLTFVWRKALDQTLFMEQEKINLKKEQNPVTRLNEYNPYTVSNYWIEYGTDSTFAAVTGRDSTLTDTTKSVTGLSNLTNYYWRVKAKNQIGWAAFSSVWKFTTIVSIPIAPVLLLPANNATGVSLSPLLDWNDVQYSASYRIQVSTDQLFNTILWDTSGVVPSQVNIPANKLTGLTQYYWRVNATNAGGTGPYSAVWNFRTVQKLKLNLKVYLEGFWDGSTQVSDTTTVYLANIFTPFAFIDSAKGFLSTSGTYSVNFTKAPNASYYIVVNHRNHLETWSKLPQAFVTNIAVNYDFTTSANKAFGDNMKQVGSVWVLYGGDGNRDGSIDALDVGVFITQFGNSGYLSCDFNGDESVDALDVPIIIANFGLGKAIPTLDVQLPGNIKKERVIEEIQKRFKLNGESDKKETFKRTENKLN
ncbi:MAG: dockerin type I domain-containing protein, partial [Ignavibacteriae bacterium]|nr:dockerin type I domain-containing protein [Ignavibacteriota bacterium]